MKIIKKIVRVMCLIVVVTVMCVGCNKTDGEETTSDTVTTTEAITTETEECDMRVVTIDEFLSYYNITADDVKDFDLQGMINDYLITKDDLSTRDWYRKLRLDLEHGITYGLNINRIIRENECRYAALDDDYSKAQYIALLVDINVKGYDYCTSENIVIDVQNKQIYYKCNFDDITKADKIIDIDDETLSEIVNNLYELNLPDVEEKVPGVYTPGGDYYWYLYIIMNKKDIIAYSGNYPTEDEILKFDDFKNKVLEYCVDK